VSISACSPSPLAETVGVVKRVVIAALGVFRHADVFGGSPVTFAPEEALLAVAA
jgi:hypothetical protein